MEYGVIDVASTFAAKGHSAGHHFIENGAEGEQVGAGVEFFASHLLRRHIGDGAERSAGAGQMRFGGCHLVDGCAVHVGRAAATYGELGESEVENFGVIALGHEKVGWLNIAMDDLLGVGGIESVGNLDGER